jgi:hypothetical protein
VIKDIFDITAVPHFGKRLWRAHGYVDVFDRHSYNSFEGHFVSRPQSGDPDNYYFQPHAMRAAWSRDPQTAIAKVKKKLCRAKSEDEAYFTAQEEREERKIFVEWNPDEECPF